MILVKRGARQIAVGLFFSLRQKDAIENELRTGEGRPVPCIRRAPIEHNGKPEVLA